MSDWRIEDGGYLSMIVDGSGNIIAEGIEPENAEQIIRDHNANLVREDGGEVERLRAALEDAKSNYAWLISGASGLSRMSHADTSKARLDARDAITTVLCKAISEIDAALSAGAEEPARG